MLAFILDFVFFGLQNGDECHCGNSASRFIPTNSSSCNKPCKGDQTELCGGSWRLNVYQTKPIYPLVHITGSILAIESFTQDIESKRDVNYLNFKNEIETDLRILLELHPLIVDASVLVTNISAPGTDAKELETWTRRKRSAEKRTIEFKAVCSVRIAENFEIGEIQSAITSSFKDVDSERFKLFDEESFSNLSLLFQKTLVIKIEAESDEELIELQGMSIKIQEVYV